MDITKIMKKYFTSDKYYTMLPMLEYGADYNVLVSERTDGKSYQVKHYVVLDALLNNRFFTYMRRYGVELKPKDATSYFEDLDMNTVNKICGTDYDGVLVFSNEIFMFKYDEHGIAQRKIRIGKTFVLATAGHKKSTVFKDHYNIVFEEFVTLQGYLFDEPRLLQDAISTILRDRVGKVFMLGNNLFRDFPYIREWGLVGFPRMKDGDIQTYTIDGVKVLVERCSKTVHKRGKKTMFFGMAKKSIEGNFVTQSQPHLPFAYDKKEVVYTMYLAHYHMCYKFEVLLHENDAILFVRPYNDPIDVNERIVTKDLDIEYTPYVSTSLYTITRGDKLVLDIIKKNRIFFSDNLTGTEYRQIIKEYL